MECEAITQAFWEFVQWGFVYGSYKTAKVTLKELRKKRERFSFGQAKKNCISTLLYHPCFYLWFITTFRKYIR
jgi:hypothetical protein